MPPPDVLTVLPGPLAGSLRVPGDKSIGHRVLMLGALADGAVTVSGVPPGGDVAATAAALRLLGARVDLEPGPDGLDGTVAGPLRPAELTLDCGNSGTALRLLAGIVAGLDGTTTLTGDDSLRRRPVDRVATPLRRMGARVSAADGGRLPPLTIAGGGLTGITYEQPVASAQVKSCVLLAGLSADGPTTVVSPAASRDHTERLLRHLGVEVVTAEGDGERVTVTPGRPRGGTLGVPGDASSAAFWWVAAAIAGTRVEVLGVGVNPRRAGVLDVLADLGATVRVATRPGDAAEPVADVTVSSTGLGSAEVSGHRVVDALDELPIVALAGAVSDGGLEVRDAAELRIKESDRIAALGRCFRGLGLHLEEAVDGFTVPGGQHVVGGHVDAEGDHRIAMTAAIAATVASGPVTIAGAAAIATSYPEFTAHLQALGGNVEGVPA